MLEAVLKLKRDNGLTADDVESVLCDIFQSGFDIAGGGAFGPKDRPRTKEQADYNLKYLIAAALLDDAVGPAQLEPSRIQAGDAQALLGKVEIQADEILTARYPCELGTRITIRTKTGKIPDREQSDYEGGLGNPLSWEREVEKFNCLSEPFADEALRNDIIELVADLDQHSIKELMSLSREGQSCSRLPGHSPRISVIFDGPKGDSYADDLMRYALRPDRRTETRAFGGLLRVVSEATGEPPDNIFFVIREGRGINFVEHGKHLPEFIEGNANDKDLISSLK